MSLLEEEGGVRFVQLGVSNRCPIDVEVLVVGRKLLEYNLLLAVDIIKRLGGVCVCVCVISRRNTLQGNEIPLSFHEQGEES